jgi:predicted dehydrogenase
MPPLQVAVIGTGAFGRNHVRVYHELEQAHPELVRVAAIVESDASRRLGFAITYSVPTFGSLSDFLTANLSVDAASICVPTIHHADIAEQLLTAGVDVLIEKPFAATLAEADRVLELARTYHRIVAIGHLERFNPAVTAAIDAVNRPMFFEAHRLSVFTPR